MLIYKITLSISGDNFIPSKLPQIKDGNLEQYYLIDPDQWFEGRSEPIGFGTLSYTHKNDFVMQGTGSEYDDDFVKFLEENQDLFQANGAEECCFYTEVCYSGDQCDFEILNKELLIRLNKINLQYTFPVSVDKLKKAEIKEMLTL